MHRPQQVSGTGKKPHQQKGTGNARQVSIQMIGNFANQNQPAPASIKGGSGRIRRSHPAFCWFSTKQGTKRAPHHRGGGRAHGKVVRSHAHDVQRKARPTSLPGPAASPGASRSTHHTSVRREFFPQVRRLGLKCALSAKVAEGNLVIIDAAAVAEPKTKALVEKLEGAKAKLSDTFPAAFLGSPLFRKLSHALGCKLSVALTRALCRGFPSRFRGGQGHGQEGSQEPLSPPH